MHAVFHVQRRHLFLHHLLLPGQDLPPVAAPLHRPGVRLNPADRFLDDITVSESKISLADNVYRWCRAFKFRGFANMFS